MYFLSLMLYQKIGLKKTNKESNSNVSLTLMAYESLIVRKTWSLFDNVRGNNKGSLIALLMDINLICGKVYFSPDSFCNSLLMDLDLYFQNI